MAGSSSKRYGGTLRLAIIFLFLFSPATVLASPHYAVAVLPAPVFNTQGFAELFGSRDGTTLRLDACGQIRELEFIALPGTVFRVENVLPGINSKIYRVTTDDYPYPSGKGYFIDSRFVEATEQKPLPPPRTLPAKATILERLLAMNGSSYVWGGNVHEGLPHMLSTYPPDPARHLTQETKNHWQLRGVDCSGLLYEATGGYTPRNTSALVSYGAAVPIAGLTARQIPQRVMPLDLIVWNGHVMIILDRETLIESRLDCGGDNGGVKIRPLLDALNGIMRTRIPVDTYGDAAAHGRSGFVIRRWYKGNN